VDLRHKRIVVTGGAGFLGSAVVRRLVLALPEVVEGSHFDHPDFRVRNKIFAGMPKDERSINVKTTPANLDALVSADPETFRDAWGGRW